MSTTAVILAAGEPRQMSHFQPMLKLNGKSVIRRQIEVFRAAGIEDILIVTGYHAGMLERAEAELGGLDTVLIAHGTLPDQAACAASVELTLDEIRTNALSVIGLATLTANRFEQQGKGTLAVISSVVAGWSSSCPGLRVGCRSNRSRGAFRPGSNDRR